MSPATIFGDEATDDLFTAGYVVDLDGDGFDDLAVGDPHVFEIEGAVCLLRGSVSSPHTASEADVVLLGGGSLGKVVRGGVDLDGDGLGDLVIRSAGEDGVAAWCPAPLRRPSSPDPPQRRAVWHIPPPRRG